VAAEITVRAQFAKDTSGRLYVFDRGVYRLGGEQFVRERVKAICKARGTSDTWSSHGAAEVTEYIRVDCDVLPAIPDRNIICVLNGLVEVPTGILRPHDPTSHSTIQIPVVFDPAARCPTWEKFVEDVF